MINAFWFYKYIWNKNMKYLSLVIITFTFLVFNSISLSAECKQTGISVKKKFSLRGQCKESISKSIFCGAGTCSTISNLFDQDSEIGGAVNCTARVRLLQVKTYNSDCRRQRRVKRLRGLNLNLHEYTNNINEEPSTISEATTNKRGIANLKFIYDENACTYNANRLKKRDNSIRQGLFKIETFRYEETDECLE